MPPLPVMMLADALPMPLIFPVRSGVRFSKPGGERLGDAVERTRSIPLTSTEHFAGAVDGVGVVAGTAFETVEARPRHRGCRCRPGR